MKTLILLLVFFSFNLSAQSYFGADNLSPCLVQEIDSASAIFGFKTIINSNPTLKLRIGYRIGNNPYVVIFLPIFNLSLREMKYNTPFNGEVRYKISDYLLIGGLEVYSDKPYFYVNILIPFR